MSDLTTIELFRIHHDPHLLSLLHSAQSARLLEREFTGGDRPAGMRLSTADPVRRVKAVFEPFWNLRFDEGVGTRGHILEDYLQVALFDDDTLGGRYLHHVYQSQVAIQWHTHGRSAFDFVVENVNATDRVVSCKSSIGGGKPTSSNVAQERRMMALAGYPAGSVFEIWVVDPGTMRAVGPYEYTLEHQHITEARMELAGVSKAFKFWSGMDADPTQHPYWNDPDAWIGSFGLGSTSGAFRFDTLDASGAIEKRNRAFLRARARASEAKRELDEAKALIRPHIEEQLAASTSKSVRAYSGDLEATYTIDKRGALLVTERATEVAENAA